MLSFLQTVQDASRVAALLWSFVKFCLIVGRNILIARALNLQLADSIPLVVTPLSQMFF
jgi:hypothetical protein